MNMKKVYIETMGCQMNKSDTERMLGILSNFDYDEVDNPKEADLLMVNTCSIRQLSEDKAFSLLGAWGKRKKDNPNLKIGICGCVAQQKAEKIFKRAPYVDFVLGTHNIYKLPEIIKAVNNGDKVCECTETHQTADTRGFGIKRAKTVNAWINITEGCNNFCTYCIIPYIRGRSRSRDMEDAVQEAYALSKFYPEIVVTGIDLSSYKHNGKNALGELLYALKDLPCRIRIGSLEVGVVTHEFLQSISKMNNLAPHFHLSLQSGSDVVLKKMNRHYTAKEYLQKVKMIRKYFPNANITTDVIVGFCGEGEKEFRQTYKLCKKAKFGFIHIFPYSQKTGTVADRWQDIDASVKKDRVHRLEKLQAKLTKNYVKKYIGKCLEVICEDIEDEYLVGYTENYIKVYLSDKSLKGKVKVKLTSIYKEGAKGEKNG